MERLRPLPFTANLLIISYALPVVVSGGEWASQHAQRVLAEVGARLGGGRRLILLEARESRPNVGIRGSAPAGSRWRLGAGGYRCPEWKRAARGNQSPRSPLRLREEHR